MNINGREIGFRRSVRATADLSEICPGKDLNRMGEMITGKNATTAQTLTLFAAMVVVLNQAYERHLNKEDPEHEPNPLTIEDVMDLDEQTFNDLVMAAFAVFKSDAVRTVNAKPAGKKKVRTKSN